jgi:hypothetical protein
MFYGCLDQATAYAETVDPGRLDGKTVSGACFKAMRSLTILDLLAIPTIQSFFAASRDRRHAIRFLEEFAKDLAQPINRDGRPYIDYVPIQVLTEYVRYELRAPDGSPFDGIKYRSSRNSQPCFVVFATQEQCLPPQRPDQLQLLGFVDGSIRALTNSALE